MLKTYFMPKNPLNFYLDFIWSCSQHISSLGCWKEDQNIFVYFYRHHGSESPLTCTFPFCLYGPGATEVTVGSGSDTVYVADLSANL